MRRYASLRGRREFGLVMRRGRVSQSKHLVVFALAPRGEGVPPRASRNRPARLGRPSARVGIVITKKVGTAVERNRLRRRCKSILDRTAIADAPMWYVVQFRPSAARLSFLELREQLVTSIAGGVRTAGQARRRRERIGS